MVAETVGLGRGDRGGVDRSGRVARRGEVDPVAPAGQCVFASPRMADLVAGRRPSREEQLGLRAAVGQVVLDQQVARGSHGVTPLAPTSSRTG